LRTEHLKALIDFKNPGNALKAKMMFLKYLERFPCYTPRRCSYHLLFSEFFVNLLIFLSPVSLRVTLGVHRWGISGLGPCA
jgi:hypothetical protein